MGTSLYGQTPGTTYIGLIKVDDTSALSATLKFLSDGDGNDSALELATNKVRLTNPEFQGAGWNVSSLEVSYLDGLLSNAQEQLNNKQPTLTYTPEDVANKSNDVVADSSSYVKYPSVRAVYDWGVGAFAPYFSYTAENVANKKTDLVANSDTYYPTQKAVNTALSGYQPTLGFTPENVANKSTSVVTDQASNTKYPSVKAVYDWGVGAFQTLLGFTPENVANKSTSVVTDQASNTKYPSVKAVYDWGVGAFQPLLGYTAENVANKSTSVVTDQASDTKYPSVKAVYDWGVGAFVTPSSTNTLTNKRITQRVTTFVSDPAPAVNTDNCDAVTITALAVAISTMSTNLTGTPTNFQKLVYRIKDNGAPRTINWGASFQAMGVALPTTTVISKVLTIGFIYDTVSAKWGCVASCVEA